MAPMHISGDATIVGLDKSTEATLRDAIAEMQPGWVLLHEPTLGDDGETTAQIRYVLLHQDIGVALLSTKPDSTAVARLQRSLDAAGFASDFGGYPPIICRMLPPAGLPLAEVLAAAFAFEPALVLSGGEKWVEAVCQVLHPTGVPGAGTTSSEAEEEQLAAEPEMPIDRNDEQTDMPRQSHRLRTVLVSCGILALALGGGATAFRYLQQPERLGPDSATDHAIVASEGIPAPSGRSFGGSEAGEPGEGTMPTLSPGAEPSAHPQPQMASLAPAADPPLLGQAPMPTIPAESQADIAAPAPPPEGPWQDAARHDPMPTEEIAIPPLDMPPSPVADGVAHEPDMPSPDVAGASAPEPIAADAPPAASAALSPGATTVASGQAEVPGQPVPASPSTTTEEATATAETAPVPPPRILAPETAEPPRAAAREPVTTGSLTMASRAAPDPGTATPDASGKGSTLPSQPALAGRSVPMAPAMLAALIRRGDAMLALHDVSAARLLYERAAAGGSGPAATAAGKTYDPAFLAEFGGRNTQADPAAAAAWYRKAITLGDHEAEVLLGRLGSTAGN